MISTIKYKQLIIMHGDNWQHDLKIMLSNYAAVIVNKKKKKIITIIMIEIQ